MGITDSQPCKERCPKCGEKCWGREGHAAVKTAGKGFAELHQDRQHCWGMLSEKAEAERAQYRETRREVVDELRKRGKLKGMVSTGTDMGESN